MKDKNKANGFTLIELLIAMVIALLLMTAIYSTYRTQQKAYLVQDQVVGMQQNLRAAINFIERDFRMMGYDPNRNANTGINVFTNDPNEEPNASDNADNGLAHVISYTKFDDSTNAVTTIIYQLADPDGEGINDDLQKSIDGVTQTIAENIQVFDLVGLNENNTPTTDPDAIRSIEITLVGKTLDNSGNWQDRNFSDNNIYENSQGTPVLNGQNDNLRRMIVTTRIKCRNLGM